MTDIVYMKYTFRPVPGVDNRFYCKRLRVTVEGRDNPKKREHANYMIWSAWRPGENGITEYYSKANGARMVFTTAQSCVESVVQSDWLVDTL